MPGDGDRESAERQDLTELLARRALTEDAARPEAVERRHAAAMRTAARTSPTSSTPAPSSSTAAPEPPRGHRFVDTW